MGITRRGFCSCAPDPDSLPESRQRIKDQTHPAQCQNAIVVEDDAVVEVKSGTVDAKWKTQGQQGYAIDPIVSALSKHRTRLSRLAQMQNQTFDGIAIIMADRRTPYRLLTEVLYSAGQAEFANYRRGCRRCNRARRPGSSP